MLYAEIVHGSEGLEKQYAIREKVFIEEQGVPKDLEQDEYDKISYHVLVIEDDEPVGTGRVIYKDGVPLIGRIAVLKNHRGKKYGDLIVRKLVDFCFRKGDPRVEIHAQVQVLDFYKGIGFIPYGEKYLEAGIEHMSMYLTRDNMVMPCKQ